MDEELKRKVEDISKKIKNGEYWADDIFITEEDKEAFRQIHEKFQRKEEEYQEYLKRNEGKKIIGYNPETFEAIFEE